MAGACTCSQLENGIYELVMSEATRRAVDEYFAHVERVARSAKENGAAKVMFLLDASQMDKNSPPLIYFFQKTRDYRDRYPDRLPTRNATVFQKGLIVSLVDTFLKSIGGGDRDQARFFSPDERDKAIDWLLV